MRRPERRTAAPSTTMMAAAAVLFPLLGSVVAVAGASSSSAAFLAPSARSGGGGVGVAPPSLSLSLSSSSSSSSSSRWFRPSPFGIVADPRTLLLLPPRPPYSSPLSMSSHDMSDYSSSSSDYEDDTSEVSDSDRRAAFGDPAYKDFDAPDEDVKLHGPVPLSKNAGNRFVALVFDKSLDRNGRDWEEMMDNRTELTRDHVFFCRKANLYNETFNQESTVDVLHSYQVLSSCATRPIGHILVLESADLADVRNFVASDPVVRNLGCAVDDVPLYRWRHVKDHTLRIDDGRYGWPNVLIQMDRPAEDLGGFDLRSQVEKPKLEYLIESERVIAAGPLHLPTEYKDDPSSVPVGDLIFFNARNRTEAIEFAENDPAARAGLYGTMRAHKYNALDVTGKFVSENLFDDGSGWYNRHLGLKEEMADMGYPVDDEQTPWLNW